METPVHSSLEENMKFDNCAGKSKVHMDVDWLRRFVENCDFHVVKLNLSRGAPKTANVTAVHDGNRLHVGHAIL